MLLPVITDKGRQPASLKLPNSGQVQDSRVPNCFHKVFQGPPNSTFTMAIKDIQGAPLPLQLAGILSHSRIFFFSSKCARNLIFSKIECYDKDI